MNVSYLIQESTKIIDFKLIAIFIMLCQGINISGVQMLMVSKKIRKPLPFHTVGLHFLRLYQYLKAIVF